MTAFTLFDTHLLTVQSSLGEAGLLVASVAMVAVCMFLAAPLRRIPDEAARTRARSNGVLLAATVALLGLVGLRTGSQAWPSDETLATTVLHWLTAGSMISAAASAAFLAVAGLLGAPHLRARPVSAAPPDDVETALRTLDELRGVMARLEQSHQEAATRALGPGEPSVLAEYASTAAVIEKKVVLGRELERAVSAAVLRLACRGPLRALLESRPDDVIAQVSLPSGKMPVVERVLAARGSIDDFLARADKVRTQLQREVARGPGSVAARVGLDADASVAAARDAVEEIHGSYGRVRHRLEALRLRVEAEADSNRVLQAALSLAPSDQKAAPDAAALASEINDTEEASRKALAESTENPERVVMAVALAAAAFKQDDHERLRDLLRAMRELTDGSSSSGT